MSADDTHNSPYPLTVEQLRMENAIVGDPKVFKVQDVIDTELTEQVGVLASCLRGMKTLVLLPTGNKKKEAVMQKCIPSYHLQNTVFETKDPGAIFGEQPYNNAGQEGARVRLNWALTQFLGEDSSLDATVQYCKDRDIGDIIVIALESNIEGEVVEFVGKLNPILCSLIPDIKGPSEPYESNQTVKDPVDCGHCLFFSLRSGLSLGARSAGVKVPNIVDFIAYAKSKGHVPGKKDQGRVTGGAVMAAFVGDLAVGPDWHPHVTDGTGRYKILEPPMELLRARAIEDGVFDVPTA